MIKYLNQPSCGRQASRLYSTVAPPWWQTVEFRSEDNIQQYGAQLSLFSFSFDKPQGGQQDKDDRIILTVL